MPDRGVGEGSLAATASPNQTALASAWTSSVVPWALLSLALLGYLAFILHYGRLFGQDDIFYKAAGFHWATDGHFAAPELTGRLPGANPPLEKVFACYPPGYPFLFVLTVRAFGFGWRQVMCFDAVI